MVNDKREYKPATTSETIVELRDVKKSYQLGQTTVPALRGVDFKVFRGELRQWVGASGSGKSTLLNMIGCIDEPDSGRIILDGVEVHQTFRR